MKRLDFLTVELLQSTDDQGDPVYLRRFSNKRWECYDPDDGGWHSVSTEHQTALEIERDAFTDPTNAQKGSGEH